LAIEFYRSALKLSEKPAPGANWIRLFMVPGMAAMEKPLATRTLIAVTSEASRIAFIVVIDSAL
jgi:hypothetical protein